MEGKFIKSESLIQTSHKPKITLAPKNDGIIGKEAEHSGGSEHNLKNIYKHLKQKKVLTEEIWQEPVNPLVPSDGLVEEDIEYFQFFEGKRIEKESGGKVNIREKDKFKFNKARSQATYKDSQVYTLKIAQDNKLPSLNLHRISSDPVSRLKSLVKVVRKPAPKEQSEEKPIEKRLRLQDDFDYL